MYTFVSLSLICVGVHLLFYFLPLYMGSTSTNIGKKTHNILYLHITNIINISTSGLPLSQRNKGKTKHFHGQVMVSEFLEK